MIESSTPSLMLTTHSSMSAASQTGEVTGSPERAAEPERVSAGLVR